jgi:exodeoxyribonuclease VII large subunit
VTGRLLPVGVFVCLLRETLESDPFYSDLWLEGEITDLSRSSAGHTYFSLRDADGALKCVLFRGQALRQLRMPRIGDSVAVHGGLSLYTRSGSMQLVVDLVRPAGLGAAALELEYLRARLEAEGLFSEERKRPLPVSPRAIGVVTSAHGAAWHDIQSVIGRRYPLVSLVHSPAQVQGDGAAESIATALLRVHREAEVEIDLIILARGGGAADDLAAFNDERVVRAIFASPVPVVTGIGHSTDRTLAEDVADLAAPTPSAAAELSVPSLAELHDRLLQASSRLVHAMTSTHANAVLAFQGIAGRAVAQSPRHSVESRRQALSTAQETMASVLSGQITASRQRVTAAEHLLHSLDPNAVLRRGYAALVERESASARFSARQFSAGSRFVVILHDGTLDAVAERVTVANRKMAAP